MTKVTVLYSTVNVASGREQPTPPQPRQTYDPGDDWYWCYVDRLVFESEGAPPAPSQL
jgi:hypothetical protein